MVNKDCKEVQHFPKCQSDSTQKSSCASRATNTCSPSLPQIQANALLNVLAHHGTHSREALSRPPRCWRQVRQLLSAMAHAREKPPHCCLPSRGFSSQNSAATVPALSCYGTHQGEPILLLATLTSFLP